MPFIILYFLKVSISLCVVYLFYQAVLRRLTFYNWNRWYLLGYSALSFLMPFINIGPVLQHSQLAGAGMIEYIPVMEKTFTIAYPITITAVSSPRLSGWDWALVLLVSGCIVSFIRLLVHYRSFLKIRKGAQLIAGDGVRIYQVNKNIIPFSFGNAVFINQGLHTEEELKEIIRHEYVHIRQRHTADIIWGELLCLVNWYNPFAWWLRRSLRQNLEFIADDKVLENGLDKKRYQYLLLKVTGVPQFHMASQFNFTSLKKRIVMMNKLKSAKVHLIKFLFVLPVISLLLIAFRNDIQKPVRNNKEQVVSISGLVVEAGSYKKLNGVKMRDSISGVEGLTDENGFFSLTISVSVFPQSLQIVLKKEGYKPMASSITVSGKEDGSSTHLIDFIGMDSDSGEQKNLSFIHGLSCPNLPDYKYVSGAFVKLKNYRDDIKTIKDLISNSEKPYWFLNGSSYLADKNGGIISWDDEMVDIIIVDGKQMTGEELNAKVKRSAISNTSTLNQERALKKYGIHQDLFEVYVNSKPQDNDMIRDTAERPSNDSKAFLKRNATVKALRWREDVVIVELKSGKAEAYVLYDENSLASAEKKYGKLPAPAPLPMGMEVTDTNNEQQRQYLKQLTAYLNQKRAFYKNELKKDPNNKKTQATYDFLLQRYNSLQGQFKQSQYPEMKNNSINK